MGYAIQRPKYVTKCPSLGVTIKHPRCEVGKMAYAPARELEQGSAFGDVEDIRSHVELKPPSKLEALFRARLAIIIIISELNCLNKPRLSLTGVRQPCYTERAMQTSHRRAARGAQAGYARRGEPPLCKNRAGGGVHLRARGGYDRSKPGA